MTKLISRNVLPFSTNANYGACSTCQSGGQKGGSIASLLQSLFPTVSVNSLMTTTGLVTASKVAQSKKKRKTTKRKTTKRKTTKRKKSKK